MKSHAKANKNYSAARGPKVTLLKERYAQYGNQFEAVAVSNIAIDQFPEALKGVDAIIHTASPLAGKEEPEVLLHVSQSRLPGILLATDWLFRTPKKAA
jgi:hypothetical protein